MNKLSSLSPREQALLRITLMVVGFVLVLAIVLKGLGTLDGLNRRIENAEQEILNLETQHLYQQSVDAAYKKVLTPHTTALSKEEIHDSLRREIYRLALKNPGATTTAKLNDKTKYLIHIPELKEGVLQEEGDGYQEYQIHFRVPSCTMSVALEYLKRIETSTLLLRVDSIEITRAHNSSNVVGLKFVVTRTILSDTIGRAGA